MSLKSTDNLEDLYPLSPMQQGMLFHTMYERESGTYFEQSVFTLEGDLDVNSFERAWQLVIERHPILRSSFIWDLEKPLQVVHREVAIDIRQEDWRDQPLSLDDYLADDRHRGFDLRTAPLIRLALFRTADTTYKFVFSRHHIVLDRWSRSIVLKEVFQAYESFVNRREPQLDRPRPYGDYISWLTDQHLEDAESYWRAELAGFTTPTPISIDPKSVNAARQGREFADERIQLSEQATARLSEFAREHKLTLSTLMQGAWALLLSTYAREEDVLFGVTVSGRSAPLSGVESMVGLFINTLPLRVKLNPESKILSWLESLQEQQFALQQYEYCSLLDIQSWGEVPRGTPLFETILVFENLPVNIGSGSANGNLKVQSDRSYGSATGYPLTLLAMPGPRFALQLVYDRAWFHSETVSRMLIHLQTVLERLVVDPERRLSEISVLRSEQKQRLLFDWNQTSTDYEKDVCVHQLIERQASLKHTAVAATFQDQKLTYAELNARANQLARHLRSLGVGPESLVGICVERSLEMLVGVLGILKAGGAYVPLDPTFPSERVAFMIEDSDLAVLVTLESLLAELPSTRAKMVVLDAEWNQISQNSGENFASAVTADNLAYVIYTSGSTGQSKGVEVGHRALTNFLFSVQQEPGIGPNDVLLAVTTLSFDIAGLELYLPLISGARVAIVESEVAADGTQLKERISSATVMQATPATWQMLINAGWQGQTGLKILCGGEALSRELANELLARGVTLWNMYGPTETTIWSTTCRIEVVGDGPITVGRPLANTQIYLLDEYHEPVPIGVAGELHIGGDGLARGYLKRPQLTAEKFIPNPFSEESDARMYKTGDLARYLANGEIEYLGRIDHQVKIRGFRIELGEIESVLRQHAQVRESVVVAREDVEGERRLVAYVVPDRARQDAGAAHVEQISRWQHVWDSTYKQTAAPADPSFNIAGWNSSYTGEPIPPTQMREWVDQTVERILSLKPRRVLEIGCGTGLLLSRIAPHCDSFHGTDLTRASIDYLKVQIAEGAFRNVTVSQQSGNDFTGIESGSFDTVILNSVVQYFPSVEYLLDVLKRVIETVQPGGSVFLGDLRSLPLLHAFHAAVQLQNAPSSLDTKTVLQRIEAEAEQEQELLVDPAFFTWLKDQLPQISDVEIQLKRGHYRNELTQFRYDVVLHVGKEKPLPFAGRRLDWPAGGVEAQEEYVLVTGVPNARIANEVRALELLRAADGPQTVGELRKALESEQVSAEDPEKFWALAGGRCVEVTWSREAGKYDVLLRKAHAPRVEVPRHFHKPTDWREYANNPVRETSWRSLVSELKRHLEERLPDYMVPAMFVELAELPLTPNGKVDRRRLPAPRSEAQALDEFVAPRTDLEELLAGIWAEVLKVSRVGVNDNFFELGGHSLLAVSMISRVRDALGVQLKVRSLFEAPTVARLARTVSQLHGNAAIPAITRVEREGHLPLSFAQERLWFLDQLEKESAFYNMPAAFRVSGTLNVEHLRSAFEALTMRHEVLRTTFAVVDEKPVQVISPTPAVTFTVSDLRELDRDAREAEMRRLTVEEVQRPFDLQSGPLLRVRLVQTGESEHVLLITTHHIVSDGWSMGILIRELTTLYDDFAFGRSSELARLPVQYVDYAIWQRQWLQNDLLEKQISYWRQQLAGMPAVLQLPKDRPRPAVQTSRGARRAAKFAPELTKALNELSRQHGATLFMTLLAAFETLLYRYSGQKDFAVGTPVAGRTAAEVEGLIGFFVNTLVMRADVSGQPSFVELLGRVRERAIEAYAHQDLPFERLVEAVQPERSLSHTPLFQVALVFQNAPLAQFDLSGLKFERLAAESGTAKFDLTLFATERADSLYLAMEYNTDLFDEVRIERMLEHLQTLMESIVGKPEKLIEELELLSERERSQLLVEWNQTESEYRSEQLLHELFEAQAARNPEQVALVFGGAALSYGELNRKANQLAHYLQARGVGPEVLVGVCIERSLMMVVGLLGILKAGGAYVPLDPAYPAERVAFMLEDSNARVVLTEEKLLGLLGRAESICLDRDWEKIEKEQETNLARQAAGENLAYVIYTSGSTGRPKGVAIAHRSTAALLAWAGRVYSPEELSGVLASTSICFDLSVFELFVPLSYGGRVVLAGDVMQLLELDGTAAVKLVNTVPSAMTELVRLKGLPQTVRTVNLAGEPLAGSLVDELYKTGHVRRVVDLYGPSEDTTYSTFAERTAGGPVTIGRPIANSRAYLLDGKLQPVPVGVAGELYLGGAGLARGYLNRPDLTAHVFVPDPFSARGGERLYRTGDLARYRADGQLEYLGRIDNQVKVRGFRIELGEIETAIKKHPHVSEALVLVREDEPGDRRLVAYVVPDRDVSESQLKRHLEERLPDYMVPAMFVELAELPLTPNGKVDRRRLPAPRSEAQALDEFVAPRTDLEELLAGIWAEVLKVSRVGVNDNFFELGGHSLLAVSMISRVRDALGVQLKVRSLFEAPTVARLARTVSQLHGNAAIPAITRVEREGHLPLSFAQERLWFLDQLEKESAFYNMPAAFRVSGTLNVEHLRSAFEALTMRHEVLRTTFAVVDEKPVQVISPTPAVTFTVSDLRSLDRDVREAEMRRLTTEEVQRPFDLQSGPLLRVKLVQTGESEHVLLITTHHIVSDGWSMGILIRELTTLYDDFALGRASQLARLPVQYVDYAIWQRQWLQNDLLEKQISYWRQQLAGMPAVLDLPKDRPRPAVQTSRGARRAARFPPELTKALNELSRRQGATLFMTLLAAFETLLYRYSGQKDFAVGTPVAGRTAAEVEGLIGFFVNTLVMRADVSGQPSFVELLGRVRERAIEAYAHQDLPFERLVEAVQPERSLSHTPLFQVALVFQNAPLAQFDLSGLKFERLAAESGTAKFDLTLFATERADSLYLAVEYNTDLFEHARIERMLEHLQTLIESIVREPEKLIEELELLSERERSQLLVEWNRTESEYEREQLLHELFEAQAARNPEQVALVFGGAALSYGELNRKANQLAHYLQARGVGPEVLVGVCIERSLMMVVGLLGILKAGGAYVPLDPAYPAERVAFMLEDSNARVVLTEEKLLGLLGRAESICLDRDWEKIEKEQETNLARQAAGENLAYVIYTSGSTGRPKGVAIAHRSTAALLAWAGRVYSPEELSGVLASTSICFDLSVFELFVPLSYGGRVVLAGDVMQLLELDGTAAVKLVNTVPSAMTELVRLKGLPQTVRTVNLAGEPLAGSLVDELYKTGHVRRVVDLYGPSEDTTYSTFAERTAGGPVTIGRPIANSRAYLLDGKLQPVPVGVAGELYLGGAGLARGYLNRPDLTAHVFVPDPFSARGGERLYRTGDLARYRADGQLEYLGRIDNQVKVRGFRIELGEIETAIKKHPHVSEALVLVREDEPGDKRLVAYVVPDREVSEWQTAWNETHVTQSIPAEEMREWVDQTVDRILSLRPQRVLEIGCGTGLLLFRLAPRVVHYHGTDPSALDSLRQQLSGGHQNVTLTEQTADDFTGINTHAFDTVILNSVVQYFPSVDYLVRVLEGAFKCLKPGGSVFLGDLRSLPLLKALHASVEVHASPASQSVSELQQRAQKRIAQEKELVIDPALFTVLRNRLPQISHANVQLKRGRRHNELTKFRYDVTLRVGDEPVQPVEQPWLDWQIEQLHLEDIRRILTTRTPEILAIRRVPDARLASDFRALNLLEASENLQTAGELREALKNRGVTQGIEPEEFWALSKDLPYEVELTWAGPADKATFDVIFRKRSTSYVEIVPEQDGEFDGPLHKYANDPLLARIAQTLQGDLRRMLAKQLPEYMTPSDFMFLDVFPITPNGKINRSALPAPGHSRLEREHPYMPPRTPIEKELARIWSEVLRKQRVGVNDNFFEIGGHSLLATQIVSRIRQHFKIELGLRSMFESPTVATLAAAVVELQQNNKAASGPIISRRRRGVSAKIEQLSSEEVDSLLDKVLSQADLKQ